MLVVSKLSFRCAPRLAPAAAARKPQSGGVIRAASQPGWGTEGPRSQSAAADSTPVPSGRKTKIAVIYYSMYGHIYKLAQEVEAGVKEVPGVEVELRQIQETLPDEVLQKMKAPPKADVPVIAPNDLPNYDGFLFGFPTRFGTAPAQVRALFDATGGLWVKGSLVGKPAGMFTSTSTQNGGIETTIFTTLPYLAHQAMIFVPPGYTVGDPANVIDEVRAGSSWGAATYAGPDNSRQPNKYELAWARHQGKYFAKIAKKLSVPDSD